MLRLDFPNAPKGAKVFSGDFSTATDTLSFEFLDLLCEQLGLDPVLVHRGQSVGGKPTTQGAFMGMPASWTCGLQMGHYAVARAVDPTLSFKIKGDDIIALWTDEMIALYRRLSTRVGLVLNEKTMVSLTYGTYCEGDYYRRGKSLLRMATHSLRAFAEDNILSHSEIQKLLRRGCSRKRLHDLQLVAHAKQVDLARRKGVNLYARQELGGLGLMPADPHKRMDQTSARMLQLLHNGQLPVNPLPQEFKGSRISRVQECLAQGRYGIDSVPEDTEYFQELQRSYLTEAQFVDACLGRLEPSRKVSTGKFIASQRSYVRKALRSPTRYHPSTYSQADEVLELCDITYDSVHAVLDSLMNSHLEGFPSQVELDELFPTEETPSSPGNA
jgi:hypothetical protein